MSYSMPLSERGLNQAPTEYTGPHLGTGDFSRLTQEQAVSVINAGVAKTHEALRLPGNAERVRERVDILNRGIVELQAYVADEAHYPDGAKKTIMDRFAQADEQTYGLGAFSRVRARIIQFPKKPGIVTDLDGTLTVLTDKDGPHSHLTQFIPGSSVAEPLLEQYGREVFPEVFATTWQPVLEQAPSIFRAAAEGVEFRPGVNQFFEDTKMKGIETLVLSANFRPFVEGVVGQIPEADGTPIVAVTANDLRATEKATVLNHFAKQDPDRPIIYIGDGSSDIGAITGVVAGYVALEGSKFAQELTERQVPFFSYRDFTDINDVLNRLCPSENAPAK